MIVVPLVVFSGLPRNGRSLARTVALTAAVLMSQGLGTRAYAADPASIDRLITRTTLSTADREAIRKYAEHWSAMLGGDGDTPERVVQARRNLLDKLRPSASDVFRDAFSRSVLPGLENVVENENGHAAVNALIITANLGTEKALDSLIDCSSLPGEKRRYVRLTAARSCGHILGSGHLTDMKPNKLARAVRRLLAGAKLEQDRLTLCYQVEAILAAAGPHLDRKTREELLGYVADAIDATAARAARPAPGDDPVELMDAIYAPIVKLRHLYLALPVPTQKTFGKRLGPSLRNLLDVASMHWTDLQNEQDDRVQLGRFINMFERFLVAIDTFVRENADSPDTRLKEAWDADDEVRYRRDLSRWSDVLSRPPY